MSDVREEEVVEEQVPEDDVEPDSSAEGEAQVEEEPIDVNELKSQLEKVNENYENLKTALHQEREEKKHWRDLVKDQQQPKEEPAEQPSLADDDYLTYGQVKQLFAQQQQQATKSRLQQQQHAAAVSKAEQTLKAEYTDYDEIAKLGIAELNKSYTPQQITQMYWQTDPSMIPRMLYGIGQTARAKAANTQEGMDTAQAMAKKSSQPKTTGVKSGKSSVKATGPMPPLGTPEYEKWRDSLSAKDKAARDYLDLSDLP